MVSVSGSLQAGPCICVECCPCHPLRLAVLVLFSCCSGFPCLLGLVLFLYPLDGPSKPFSLSVGYFVLIRSEHLTASVPSVTCLVGSSDVKMLAVLEFPLLGLSYMQIPSSTSELYVIIHNGTVAQSIIAKFCKVLCTLEHIFPP